MSKAILLSEVITSLSLEAKVEETLKKAIEVEVSNAVKAAKEETEAEKAEMQVKINELTLKTAEATGEILGTYTDPRSKKTYRFKNGVVKFKFQSKSKEDKGFVEYKSSEVIKDKALMAELIALEVGFLEEVIED